MNKPVYVCDPNKNKDCPKTWCKINGGECAATTRLECAKLNPDGTPIIDPWPED